MVRVALVAAFTALAITPEASAAMCVRLSLVPAQPRVGGKTTIQLRTFAPLQDRRLRPWAVRSHPFRVEAFLASGRVHRVPVRRSADDYVWRGTFSFPRRGRWTIRVANLVGAEAWCAKPLLVRVTAERR